MDYVIGDRVIFRETEAHDYSEKIVRLPHSYQPNDGKRIISETKYQRADFELPMKGFVFCCFNSNYKVLPATFNSWIRILDAVEGSVLWLFAENSTAVQNLKREAGIQGMDPTRLVFAHRMPLPEHLARHKLADLFLDTLPYNAHTTASDALWAGVPVLTQIGKGFAGRVAASLLNAVGLPELITQSREEYEGLAIRLALNGPEYQAIRDKLKRNRLSFPLFDTALYTRHLEAAYSTMYQRLQSGLPPEDIGVTSIE
jgi:predicted O-linked N-acetylglucosamine transferase (SPINDLY family)